MADFLFNIGDTLTHKGLLTADGSSKLLRLFVVSRTREECPGGVQNHYICRAVNPGFHPAVRADLERFNEVELTPLPPEPTSLREKKRSSTATYAKSQGRRKAYCERQSESATKRKPTRQQGVLLIRFVALLTCPPLPVNHPRVAGPVHGGARWCVGCRADHGDGPAGNMMGVGQHGASNEWRKNGDS